MNRGIIHLNKVTVVGVTLFLYLSAPPLTGCKVSTWRAEFRGEGEEAGSSMERWRGWWCSLLPNLRLSCRYLSTRVMRLVVCGAA